MGEKRKDNVIMFKRTFKMNKFSEIHDYYDFKEIVVLTDDYPAEGSENMVYLCIPATVEHVNENVFYIDNDDKYYYYLIELYLDSDKSSKKVYRRMNRNEVLDNVKKLCVLVDLLFSYYSFQELNLKQLENVHILDLSFDLGELIVKDNGLVHCSSNGDYSVVKNTYFHHFIEYAYQYYSDNMERIILGKDSEFFSRLLIGFFTIKFNNSFFINYMMNPYSYIDVSSSEIISSIIKDYHDSGFHIEYDYHVFCKELYYRSTIDPQVIISMGEDKEYFLEKLYELHEVYYDTEYLYEDYMLDDAFSAINNRCYSVEPENINNLAQSLVKQRDIMQSILKNTSYPHIEQLLPPVSENRNINKYIVDNYLCKFFTIGSHYNNEEYFNNVSTDIVAFLHSDPIIEFHYYYQDEQYNTIDFIHSELKKETTIGKNNNHMHLSDNDNSSFWLIPHMIKHANRVFKLSIDPAIVNQFCEYYYKTVIVGTYNLTDVNHTINYNLIMLRMCNLVIPVLNDKEKIERFMMLFPNIYYYCIHNTSVISNDGFMNLMTLMLNDDTMFNSIVNNEITIAHLTSIMIH